MTGYLVEFLIKSSVLLTACILLTYCRHLSAAERHGLAFTGFMSLVILVTVNRLTEWQILIPIEMLATTGFDAASPVAGSNANPAESVSWIWIIYVGVAALLAAQAITGWIHIARRLGSLVEPNFVVVFARLISRVRFRMDFCSSPWTWGIRKAFIVLPTEFPRWPLQKQRNSLRHELAHVKRCDCLVQICCHVLVIIFWFQPLVWLLRHRLQQLAEHACDDRVLRQGAIAHQYAQCLLDIARQNGQSQPQGVPMGRHPLLVGRIDAILSSTVRRTPLNWPANVVLVMLFSALVLPLAAVTTQPSLIDHGPDSDQTDSVREQYPQVGKHKVEVAVPSWSGEYSVEPSAVIDEPGDELSQAFVSAMISNVPVAIPQPDELAVGIGDDPAKGERDAPYPPVSIDTSIPQRANEQLPMAQGPRYPAPDELSNSTDWVEAVETTIVTVKQTSPDEQPKRTMFVPMGELVSLHQSRLKGDRLYKAGKYKEAFPYLLHSAQRGLKVDQARVGYLRLTGLGGVKQDNAAALGWIGVAALNETRPDITAYWDQLLAQVPEASRSELDQLVRQYAENFGTKVNGVRCDRRSGNNGSHIKVQVCLFKPQYPNDELVVLASR